MTSLNFIGNSHVAAVKDCIRLTSGALFDSLSPRYAASNWFKHQPWHDFVANDYLSRIEYVDSIPVTHVPHDQVKTGPHDDAFLCLVGLGLHGHGIYDLFSEAGEIGDYRTDPRPYGAHTPHLPLVWRKEMTASPIQEARLSDRLFSMISQSCLMEIYASSLTRLLGYAHELVVSGIYKKVFWIPAPMMNEDSAILRFGAEYVASGQLADYLASYDASLCDTLHSTGLAANPRFELIEPCCQVEMTCNGLSSPRYATGVPGDAHVTPDYFIGSLASLSKLMLDSNGA